MLGFQETTLLTSKGASTTGLSVSLPWTSGKASCSGCLYNGWVFLPHMEGPFLFISLLGFFFFHPPEGM